MRRIMISILICSILFMFGCTNPVSKKITLADKFKYPGGYSDSSNSIKINNYKSFDEYEQKEIIDKNLNAVIANVKCTAIEHYIYIDSHVMKCKTKNTIQIEKIVKKYDNALYNENQIIVVEQHYGFLPSLNQESSCELFLRKNYSLDIKTVLQEMEGSEFLVNLNDGIEYDLFISFNGIIFLDEGEEYLVVLYLETDEITGDQRDIMTYITPYNTEKYQDLFDNKYPNISQFSQNSINLRNSFKAKYMQ